MKPRKMSAKRQTARKFLAKKVATGKKVAAKKVRAKAKPAKKTIKKPAKKPAKRVAVSEVALKAKKHIHALKYLADVEENETRLMVASSLGLIDN